MKPFNPSLPSPLLPSPPLSSLLTNWYRLEAKWSKGDDLLQNKKTHFLNTCVTMADSRNCFR